VIVGRSRLGTLGTLDRLGEACLEPGRDSGGFLVQLLFEDRVDGVCARAGATREPRDRDAAGCRERLDECTRNIEDALAVAPAHAQRVAGDGLPGTVRPSTVLPGTVLTRGTPAEPRREVVEPRRARAAPAVDRLVRVADRHDGCAAEELREQPGLRDVRVLILVEQHDPVPLADALADSGVRARDLQGQRHLVGERDVALAPLRGLELLDEVAQRQRGLERRGIAIHVGAGEPVGAGQLAHAHDLGDESPQVVDARVVLSEPVCEAQHGLGGLIDGEIEVGEPGIRRGGHEVASKLPRARLAQHDALRVAPEQYGVVAVEARGEGVVRRHGGLREGVDQRTAVGAGRQQTARPERDETRPDARGQLPRRLTGEREAEHALGCDVPVGDEPQHSCGHRLGLARAGPRNDERGAERRLDHGALLDGGAVDAERVGDRVSTDRCARAAHESSPVTGGTRCTRWAREP